MSRFHTALIAGTLAILTGGTAVAAPAEAVPAPSTTSYLQPDGAITLIGNDGMDSLLGKLNALYAQAHPGARFTMTLKGSSTALPALTAGVTLLAPMAREAWRAEAAGFKQVYGYEATPIRIGYSGYGPRPPAKTPPAIYVNGHNPLAGVSVAQLAQVFASGAPDGDVHLWSQLGVDGDWAGRRIHVYGLRDNGGFATAFRAAHFKGLPFTATYEPLESYAAVIKAVAADPYGIGLAGWVNAAAVSGDVRILPVAEKAGGAYATPAYDDVRQGHYPLSAPVVLYVNHAPGQPLDPVAKEYVALALSSAGQAALATESAGEEGYVPLSPTDLAAELAKLNAL
ncbi:MAG: substrate-binding domain-containing protein [Azospirillaceae bacterium]|nr:substrate-binding domain-containing protein [Azospirillaceae bacterium]